MTETNGNQTVGNISGNAFETICPGYNAEVTLSLSFSIDSLDSQPTSEEILVANHLKWYLRIEEDDDDGERHIVASVASKDMKKYPLTYFTTYTIEAKNTKDRFTTSTTSFCYDEDSYDDGLFLISCDKLLKDQKKFITDGKVTVTAKLKVSMPMCYNFNALNSFSDVTIKVSKVPFPFSKGGLAMHSSFFNAMFFGSFKESQKDVVVLKDVNLSAFVNLINFLFVRSFLMYEDLVPSVLELADRFGMISIVDHCEKLLITHRYESKPCLTERLIIATKFSLRKLQERCLELCDSPQVIREVTKSPFYKDLSTEVRAMLLDRMVEVMPIL